MKRIVLLATLLLVPTGAVSAQPEPPKVRAQSSTNRSILLLGQPVVYTLTLDVDSGVTVVADDLSGDALQLEGLELVDARVDRQVADNGAGRFVATYTLRSFDPGATTRRVLPRIVRYAVTRPGSRDAEAFELPLPAVELAWRSALPDEIRALEIKSIADPQPMSHRTWWTVAAASGIGGLLLCGWLWVARRPGAARPRPAADAHDIKVRLLAELDRLGERPMATPLARRTFADALDEAMRRHLAEVIGATAWSLTSRELAPVVAGRLANADGLASVLSQCEQLRFRPVAATDEASCRAAAGAARAWCEGM